jgi:phosphoserine aminotransferase
LGDRCVKQLKLKDARILKADYGALPDLARPIPKHDIVFLWNGTTSGVRVPNGDWIAADREGITICDATSAAFAMDCRGTSSMRRPSPGRRCWAAKRRTACWCCRPRGRAAGSYTPHWPLPKIFRMTKGGKLVEGIFEGETINTPSMLALEDYLDALKWAAGIGGLKALIAAPTPISPCSRAGCAKPTGPRSWRRSGARARTRRSA